MVDTRLEEVRVCYVTRDRELAETATSRLEDNDDILSTAIETDPDAVLDTKRLAGIDCVVVASLDSFDPIDYCSRIQERSEDVPCIIHARDGSQDLARRALNADVDAYVRGGDETQYAVLAQRIRTHIEKTYTRRNVQLLSSEYQLVSDVASDVFWTYDIEDEEFVVDDGIQKFGYDPEESGNDIEWWLERVHSDDVDRIRSLYTSMLAGDRAVFDSDPGNTGRVTVEFKLEQADGSSVVVLVRTLCLFDDEENPVRLVGSVTEITDQRESHEQFASLVEFSSTVISVVDEQGTYEYNSPSVERVLGYTPEELRGTFSFQYVHPDDRERVQAEFYRMVESTDEVVASAEFRARHKDGSWVWLEARGSNRTDTAIDGYVINYTDVNERKQYEQELEQFKQQYDAIFDDEETFIGRLDTDWRMLEVNDTALAFIDAEREAVIGELFPETPWWENASVDRETLEDHLQRATDGETVRFDAKLRGVEGQRRFVDVVLFPVTDENGINSLMAIGRNITELKRREQALDSLHEATRELADAKDRETVIERAVEAVETFLEDPLAGGWLYDEGTDTLQPVASTEAGTELVGEQPVFTGGDSLAWNTFEAGESRMCNDVTAEPDRYSEGPTTKSEMYLPLSDIGILLIGAAERDAFDEIDFALARLLAANTGAALHRAEREDTLRQQRTQLQQQNDQLEQVASILSHDLRNPLNVATLRTEIAQQETGSPHLDDVQTALSRMEQLIEDVLRLTRGSQTVSETEPIPIQDIVSECWTVVTTADATLELTDSFSIRGDPSQFRHVLENLFGNSVQHAGTDVTIRVGRLEGDDSSAGFYVEDDGPGIPEDDREEIFEAGYTNSDDGTGFGLTIVETIANSHGWEVTVTESSEGGARFEFGNVEFVG
jgi:PAS domain S-box-containing protein